MSAMKKLDTICKVTARETSKQTTALNREGFILENIGGFQDSPGTIEEIKERLRDMRETARSVSRTAEKALVEIIELEEKKNQ